MWINSRPAPAPCNVSSQPLTRDALNRALLARQMLLARETVSPVKVVERLAGMQAQQARPPFIGLWTRLENFSRNQLIQSLQRKTIVRATMMRATVHLMSARDYLDLRGALQPMLAACIPPSKIKALGGESVEAILKAGRSFYAKTPRPFNEMVTQLETQFPKAHPRIAAVMVRLNVPKLQIPTEAPWGYTNVPEWLVAEKWLGKPVPMTQDLAALVKKYLAAFGPATPADAQAWSGCKGLRAVFEEMRPRLKTFQNEKGQELFDLPRAPRPAVDTPAPVRFIPDFDNLILSHADRTRIVDDEYRPALVSKNLLVRATYLVNGRVAGMWKVELARQSATLIVEPFAPIPAKAKAELKAEGERLLHFIEPNATTHKIQFKK